jgi:DNA processing protein
VVQLRCAPLEEGRLLALLSHDPVHIDELSRQSALPAPTVSSTLMILELKGAIRQVGTMSYVLAH